MYRVRELVPGSVKRPVRAARNTLAAFELRLRARRRARVLRNSVDALLAADDHAPVSYVQLARLSFAWGNEKFGAGPEFLAAVIDAARVARGPILECGCGLSTIVLGIEARKRGLDVYALEHDPYWAKRTRDTLDRHGIGGVKVLDAPLRSYGAFDWYDVRRNELPGSFALIVCDGPPAEECGRYGLMPVLGDLLRPGAEILLDDADREDERRIISRWVGEFGLTSTIANVGKPFARLHLHVR